MNAQILQFVPMQSRSELEREALRRIPDDCTLEENANIIRRLVAMDSTELRRWIATH